MISNWSRFEIIFISNLLLDIYSATTPVSIYLQNKTINYLQAWNMIPALKKEIEKKRNDEYVLNLYKKCQNFCKNK